MATEIKKLSQQQSLAQNYLRSESDEDAPDVEVDLDKSSTRKLKWKVMVIDYVVLFQEWSDDSK
jgi:hypothetical protein